MKAERKQREDDTQAWTVVSTRQFHSYEQWGYREHRMAYRSNQRRNEPRMERRMVRKSSAWPSPSPKLFVMAMLVVLLSSAVASFKRLLILALY